MSIDRSILLKNVKCHSQQKVIDNWAGHINWTLCVYVYVLCHLIKKKQNLNIGKIDTSFKLHDYAFLNAYFRVYKYSLNVKIIQMLNFIAVQTIKQTQHISVMVKIQINK